MEKGEKEMKRLFGNNKGVSPVLSSTIIVGITIACMLVAQQFAQGVIMTSHNKMGEKLCVEQIYIDDTTIQIYARNIGEVEVVIQFGRVNGETYNLTEGNVILFPKVEGQFVTIENYEISPEGAYRIELVTARWNSFETKVSYQ